MSPAGVVYGRRNYGAAIRIFIEVPRDEVGKALFSNLRAGVQGSTEEPGGHSSGGKTEQV